jgi:hypothetical protein
MVKRGLPNSEFIKLSPTLLENVAKPAKKLSKKKAKKIEQDTAEIGNVMDSLGDDPIDESSVMEFDNDDDL